MQIGLVILGRVVVDDHIDLVDVDTAGGDVGGYQHVQLAPGEVRQGLFSEVLTQITMDGGGLDALRHQGHGHPIRAPLGTAEDQHPVGAADDGSGHLHLVHLMDEDETVHHLLDGDLTGIHLVEHRVGLVLADQAADDAVEGGGEQQGLVATADVPQDPLDLGQEPHVGHPVGLVDDHVVDIGHRQLALAD